MAIRQMMRHLKLPTSGVVFGLPTAPTLALSASTSTSVTLAVTEPSSWGTGSGQAYTLQQGSDGLQWPTSESLSYPQTSISKTGLTPGSTHWYRIGAVTSKGTRWSNEIKAVLPTGTPWGTGGKVITDLGGNFQVAYGGAIQDDGKIILAGFKNTTQNDCAVVRYNTDGSLDSGFGTSGVMIISFSSFSQGNAVAIQGDGKIIVVGNVGNGTAAGIARLTSSGSLDTSFNTTGKLEITVADGSTTGNALAILGSGKILVAGGALVNADSAQEFFVLRLNSNGSLDTGFGTSGFSFAEFGTNAAANDLLVQSDNKIVLVGKGNPGGNDAICVARFSSAGATDSGYGTSGLFSVTFAGFSSISNCRGTMLSDKVFACGQIQGADTRTGICAITSAGALDTTFNTTGKTTYQFTGNTEYPAASNSLQSWSIGIQADGKIIVGGDLAIDSPTDNTYPMFALRVNSDGSIDSGFGDGGISIIEVSAYTGGEFDAAYVTLVQSDSKTLLAGEADDDVGSKFGSARLLSNGSLDA